MNVSKNIIHQITSNTGAYKKIEEDPTVQTVIKTMKEEGVHLDKDQAREILDKLDLPLSLDSLEKVVGGVRGRTSFNRERK